MQDARGSRPSNGGSGMQPRRGSGVALAAVLAAAAALGAGGTALAQDRGTTLTWSFPSEPPAWNYWQAAPTALMAPTLHNVLEPLLEQLGDGTVGPWLADSWEISDDGLIYTFHIREAKFHDGSDLDADDVVYSLLKNKVSPIAVTKGPLVPVVSVEAVDRRTVRLTLSTPSQRLLGELGSMSGIIVPENFHETRNAASEMIGSGPYVFGEYRPDVHLMLERFEDYWGDKPHFERIVHRFIPDETSAINALLAGEIDMVASVVGEGMDRARNLDGSQNLKLVVPEPLYIQYVFLNPRNETLRDIRVRQAIAHAIYRDDILFAAQSGIGKTICQIVIPFTEPWNNGYCPYDYDPQKSRALLREAGIETLRLSFPYIITGQSPQIKDLLVFQFEEAGIVIEPRPMDVATWLDRAWWNGDYDATVVGGVGKAEAFICRGGRPPLGAADNQVCIEGFDDLVRQSDTILDRAEYIKVMERIVGLLAESAWVIPLYAQSFPALARDGIVGFKPFIVYGEIDARRLRWTD